MTSLAETLDSAAKETIRAALVAASGNVRAAAAALSRHPATLHRQIARLGLRAWLTEAYDRADRQPVREQNRTSARPKRKADK